MTALPLVRGARRSRVAFALATACAPIPAPGAARAQKPALMRVASAGGSVTTPKVQLPDGTGCFAHITDTEGNRVGLHAAA